MKKLLFISTIFTATFISCSTPQLIDLKADFAQNKVKVDEGKQDLFAQIAEAENDKNQFQKQVQTGDNSQEEVFKWIEHSRRQWNDINKEYKQLNEKFIKLGQSADAMFSKNYEMINSLPNNDPHKERLRQKYNEIKNSYLEDFIDAKREISNLNILIGNAFITLTKLEIISSMEDMMSIIGELSGIFQQAEILEIKLNMFSEESNKLIETKLNEL